TDKDGAFRALKLIKANLEHYLAAAASRQVEKSGSIAFRWLTGTRGVSPSPMNGYAALRDARPPVPVSWQPITGCQGNALRVGASYNQCDIWVRDCRKNGNKSSAEGIPQSVRVQVHFCRAGSGWGRIRP